MEGFFAADQEQLSYIKKIIDECDYYILIIAGRYGSVDELGIGYTEREYDYAVGKGVNVLAFIHNDIATLPSAKVDSTPEDIQCLELFKERVSKRRLVSFWTNREQLRSNIIISLSKSMGDTPGIGWVRGNMAAAEDILGQINEFRNQVDLLQVENAGLKDQLRPRVENIAPLHGTFEVNYRYWDQERRNKYTGTLSVSWEDLFKSIGPSFYSPSNDTVIKHCVERVVRSAVGDLRTLSVSESDIDVIKIQMTAYGFLVIYSAQTVNGGLSEFIQLTELGKRVLVELTAVRASQPVT